MPIYMRIAGIDGESTSEGHRNWFDVFTFSWGEHNARVVGSGGGGGSGRVSMQDFTVGKPSGKGSPVLMLACASGRTLPAVQFEVTTANTDREILLQRFTLNDCVMTNYEVGGDGGSSPTETMSLNFTRIEFLQTFFQDGALNSQDTFWDLRSNTGGTGGGGG